MRSDTCQLPAWPVKTSHLLPIHHILDASGDVELNNYKLGVVETQMEEVWVPELQHGAESLTHHDSLFRLQHRRKLTLFKINHLDVGCMYDIR